MTGESRQSRAVDLLQELGLRQYEAKCFVALTRVTYATAREISEVSDVPRTRVYEATESLENRGLVEVQQSQPQRFRSIPLSEAISVLRRQYETRVEELHDMLSSLDQIAKDRATADSEVWTLSGDDAVASRSRRLIDDTDDELVFVVDDTDRCGESVVDRLTSAGERGVDVFLGTLDDSRPKDLAERIPDARTVDPQLDWLRRQTESERARLGRVLVADRDALLVSATRSSAVDAVTRETAVCTDGFGNGLLLIARRAIEASLDEDSASL